MPEYQCIFVGENTILISPLVSLIFHPCYTLTASRLVLPYKTWLFGGLWSTASLCQVILHEQSGNHSLFGLDVVQKAVWMSLLTWCRTLSLRHFPHVALCERVCKVGTACWRESVNLCCSGRWCDNDGQCLWWDVHSFPTGGWRGNEQPHASFLINTSALCCPHEIQCPWGPSGDFRGCPSKMRSSLETNNTLICYLPKQI